jgi:hypothetical protein
VPTGGRVGSECAGGSGAHTVQNHLSSASRSLRIVFTGAVILIAALLAVFAYSLAASQHRQRRDAEKRFHDRAAVSAALTDAIFSISAMQTQVQDALRFGGPRVDRAALARTARQSQALYVEIVDAEGRLLASTTGAPAHAAVPSVTGALSTGRTQLSNLLPGPGGAKIVEWAIPFRGRSGKRVQLSGVGQALLGQFLGGFLAKVPNVAGAKSYVIDGNGLVIGSTTGSVRAGTRLPDRELAKAVRDRDHGDYDGGRYFTSAAIAGSPWHIVLSASNDDLFDSINGGRRAIPWVIFAAFALAAGIGLFLLRRVLLAGRQLEHAELSRTHALEINDNIVQRLVVAKYALDRGSTDTSQEKLAETLHEAQQLVTSLLEEKEISPGVLRRGAAADTERAPEPSPPGTEGS